MLEVCLPGRQTTRTTTRYQAMLVRLPWRTSVSFVRPPSAVVGVRSFGLSSNCRWLVAMVETIMVDMSSVMFLPLALKVVCVYHVCFIWLIPILRPRHGPRHARTATQGQYKGWLIGQFWAGRRTPMHHFEIKWRHLRAGHGSTVAITDDPQAHGGPVCQLLLSH